MAIDFDLLAAEAAYVSCFLDDYRLRERPIVMWRAAPPVTSGLSQVLRYARLGLRVRAWYATGPALQNTGSARFLGLTIYTALAGRIHGMPMPVPRYLPMKEARTAVLALADLTRRGTAALFDTGVSTAVAVCRAALRLGLDVSGTFFRMGGEPLTESKVAVLRAAGCAGAAPYSLSETGNVAMPCAGPAAPADDVHVMLDKMAIWPRRRTVGRAGRVVDELILTTLQPFSPKLMLNVESDDYGTLERRPCGCTFGRLGFDLHLRQIRSFDKLTSNGVTFLGTDLVDLLERVLPAAFGGGPTDYQLAERERNGVTEVRLLVGPSVGPVDESRVLAAAYAFLDRVPGGRIMANEWRQAGTLRVVRREPYRTRSSKVLPLHVLDTVPAPGRPAV